MNKVTGIKSIDFKVVASGSGVVNWNGNFPFVIVKKTEDGEQKTEIITNHTIPKLRGYSNIEIYKKEENEFKKYKKPNEVDFKKNPLYISQNCIRHHLFKDESYDFHFASKRDLNKDPKKLLLSISGLLRGYVIPGTQCKRKSPLLIEDFVDQLGNGNFEQFANSGEKNTNSMFSKITFGKTKYLAYGSISIEDLQFISLDKKFDREAYTIKKEEDGKSLAIEITSFISLMNYNSHLNPKAKFGYYSRKGSIYQEPEAGILLNEDAINILVDYLLELIEELSIKQAKGWMSVDSVEKDYNSSTKMMRIIKDEGSIEDYKEEKYAIYYEEIKD